MSRRRPTILAVDDNPTNLSLLFDLLDHAGFEVLVSQNGESALKRAEETHPDIILLDVMMPGMDGFETCCQLKENDVTKDIPIMFMTALVETVEKVKGFALGAVDYITKPIEPEEVLARVTTHLTIQRLQNELKVKNALLADREVHLLQLVEEKTQKIENITLTLVNVLEHATLLSDEETGQHVKRIGVYSAFLAEKYGCEWEFVRRIKLYAPLHDVGKVGLPDILLKKAGKYTTEEWIHMQQHVVFGAHLLANEEIDDMARNIALYHHERWDGTGYVHQLAGEKIPLEARIVTLVDVYDALISKRVYKEAFPEEKVDQILRAESGKHFDPQLVEIFFTSKRAIQEIRTTLG
jgi:putative two-component system response regulator